MTEIQMPPPPAVAKLCDCVDKLIEAYSSGFERGKIRLGRYESEVEAYTLQKLVVRQAEATILMARHDLVLLPSAHVTARSCFETHIRIKWMLHPIDPYEREIRWVSHLRTGAEQWGKFERNPIVGDFWRSKFGKQKQALDNFAQEISDLLSKDGYPNPEKLPNLWEMLKELGQPELYMFYVWMSAFAHSNFEAATIYRKNLGCGKELGEFIDAKDWALPLEIVWKSLFESSRRILELVETPDDSFAAAPLAVEFQARLNELLDYRSK